VHTSLDEYWTFGAANQAGIAEHLNNLKPLLSYVCTERYFIFLSNRWNLNVFPFIMGIKELV